MEMCHFQAYMHLFPVQSNLLTLWHGNTEDLALWSHSPPVGGSYFENVTLSWGQTIYGGCSGAATICDTFHAKWFHSRGIRQNIFCESRAQTLR